jgi:GTP-binding protein EngB required for normal cell division
MHNVDKKIVPTDEREFFSQLEARIEHEIQSLDQVLNIAVFGRVSSGKSSFINAFLDRNCDDLITQVGAQSGVTDQLRLIRLDEQIRVVDTPGLDDTDVAKSRISIDCMEHIDVGILILDGSCDASQTSYLTDLQEKCDSVFVVLNKIDNFDNYDGTFAEILDQWKKILGITKIYPVCTLGFDPRYNKEKDIRGISDIQKDVLEFLAKRGADIILARHMGNKKEKASKIILAAVLLVVPESLIPGAALVAITATQAVAIAKLSFLYTGKSLPIKALFSIIPTFTTQTIIPTAFLWAQSFLPPTGVFDFAAAIVAATTTSAMLLTINFSLERGEKLSEYKVLQPRYKQYFRYITDQTKGQEKSKCINPAFLRSLLAYCMKGDFLVKNENNSPPAKPLLSQQFPPVTTNNYYGDYIANGDKVQRDKIAGNKTENTFPNATEVKIFEQVDNYNQPPPNPPKNPAS